MEKQLEKLVNTLKLIGTIDNICFSYKSEKYYDDYYLNIKIVRKHSNNEAMLIMEEDISTMRLKIRINSTLLFNAYSQLNEDEKIPEHLNIINPCAEDNYMNSVVELCYLEIINNLKAFNGISDNYDAIARLASNCFGYHSSKKYSL
jgi:hypothetical protein